MKSWYFDLNRVAQDDDHGCGIACVATVCGVTYARARNEFFPWRQKFKDDRTIHVGGGQMMGVIRRLGFSVVSVPKFRHIKRPAIVVFQWHPGLAYSGIHGVVWDPFARKFIDPGYDHDRGLPNGFYFDLWERSGFRSLVVTGKRGRDA